MRTLVPLRWYAPKKPDSSLLDTDSLQTTLSTTPYWTMRRQTMPGHRIYADTADMPRTDDPRNDQAAYDAAMREYMQEIDRLIAPDVDPVGAIAALPKPVKGGER